MPRLDYLLDNDTLSPAKEREIRRLLNYTIKRDDGKIFLTYSFIDFRGETSTSQLAVEDIDELKFKAYRHVMIHLIKNYTKHVGLTIARVAIKTILEKGIKEPPKSGTWLDDKDGGSYRIPEFKNIKIESLFKSVQILKKEEVIFNVDKGY